MRLQRFLAENKVIYLDIYIREQTSPSFSSVLDPGTIGERNQIKLALSLLHALEQTIEVVIACILLVRPLLSFGFKGSSRDMPRIEFYEVLEDRFT